MTNTSFGGLFPIPMREGCGQMLQRLLGLVYWLGKSIAIVLAHSTKLPLKKATGMRSHGME
jgi:hypothetical protein